MRSFILISTIPFLACTLLAACGGGDGEATKEKLPQLGEAKSGSLQSCDDLAARFQFPDTEINKAEKVALGVLSIAGRDIPEHCKVTGSMHRRVGVNGNYAIGFEMRLPVAWNGRFYYQANGGLDGIVVTATGSVNGGRALTSALAMGFAVISSDAGHSAAQNAPGAANFGEDPQARLDYGYQAVAKLTPMAKELIKQAYSRGPDRSYIGGCSNGGRHTMVAAARYADEYDGYLVGNPGFNLPLAATANIAGYQQYRALASDPSNASSGFTENERTTVASAILGKCDALDGLADGMIQNIAACKTAFDLERDVPTCTSARIGNCLTAEQKTGIKHLFAGVTTATGQKIYTSWPYDNGIQSSGWSSWKFEAPMDRDSVAVGQVWMAPPMDATSFNGPLFAATADITEVFSRIHVSSGNHPESAMSFMPPPNPTNLTVLKNRGAKMMIYHGTADPIFSSDDTAQWYEALSHANEGDASNFARYYQIPGMNHCSGGPATDQFDMLTPLIAWVERGQVPSAVIATARGAGNAAGANADVPTTWSTDRTRPLCPYPQIATYNGSGSVEDAKSFSCK